MSETPRVPGGTWPNLRDKIARERIGDPKWEPCIWQCIGERDKGGAVLISGGEPHIKTRGKYKGEPSWKHIPRDQLTQVVVTEAELRAAEIEYEKTTGNCHWCGGGGKETASVGIDGVKYRDCHRCRGTGGAPSTERGDSEP